VPHARPVAAGTGTSHARSCSTTARFQQQGTEGSTTCSATQHCTTSASWTAAVSVSGPKQAFARLAFWPAAAAGVAVSCQPRQCARWAASGPSNGPSPHYASMEGACKSSLLAHGALCGPQPVFHTAPSCCPLSKRSAQLPSSCIRHEGAVNHGSSAAQGCTDADHHPGDPATGPRASRDTAAAAQAPQAAEGPEGPQATTQAASAAAAHQVAAPGMQQALCARAALAGPSMPEIHERAVPSLPRHPQTAVQPALSASPAAATPPAAATTAETYTPAPAASSPTAAAQAPTAAASVSCRAVCLLPHPAATCGVKARQSPGFCRTGLLARCLLAAAPCSRLAFAPGA
jgi:hypothetical protein